MGEQHLLQEGTEKNRGKNNTIKARLRIFDCSVKNGGFSFSQNSFRSLFSLFPSVKNSMANELTPAGMPALPGGRPFAWLRLFPPRQTLGGGFRRRFSLCQPCCNRAEATPPAMRGNRRRRRGRG